MIDLLKRILVTLVCSLVIVYTFSLLYTGTVIVQPDYIGSNLFAGILLLVMASYILIVYGVYPFYHPMQKRTLLVLGIGSIIVGQSVFLNNVESVVYTSDLVKLFGVLLVWFGATGVLTKNKSIQSQKKHKNIEIIEA